MVNEDYDDKLESLCRCCANCCLLHCTINTRSHKSFVRHLNHQVDPGFTKVEEGKGGLLTMASELSASLNGALGVEPPAGSRGSAPGEGSGGEAS